MSAWAGLWRALVDPSQLENALLNLCINARDAMGDRGRVTIETANRWIDRDGSRQYDMPEGQYLSLCVSDTGTGMTADVIAKAFDPFFTTKPSGEGTGLASGQPEVERALEDAQSRVQTIAQVHDRLWRAHEVHTINLAEFLAELIEHLRTTAPAGLVLHCDFAPMTVATDQAVPLGLLVNELVTNAVKYAYPEGNGEVWASIRDEGGGRLRLVVCDGGIGLPTSFHGLTSASLGRKLINSLSRQLGGKPQWEDVQPGTRFVLDFVADEEPRGG